MRAQYILQPCTKCGAQMQVSPSQVGRKKFCSRACQYSGHSLMKSCLQCGKEYREYASSAERSKFCSRQCLGKYTSRSQTDGKFMELACSVCGLVFTTTRNITKRHTTCSAECRSQAKAKGSAKLNRKTKRACQHCGKTFMRPPCREGRYCSRRCSSLAVAVSTLGIRRNALTVPCTNCGASVTKPRCRIERAPRVFCNKACYHAWDKRRKGTPEMREMTAQRIADGTFASPSGVEDRVALWMDTHGITYERQVRIAYRTVDFKCGDTVVEVHGCYWHGCIAHYPNTTAPQRKRQSRDKEIVTLCAKRGLTLLVIWEHDIKQGDFSALHHLGMTTGL